MTKSAPSPPKIKTQLRNLGLMELEKRFSSEEACRKYLEAIRWPQGFICPRCRTSEYWMGSRGRKICVS